jgi:CHAD domain-containing protein
MAWRFEPGEELRNAFRRVAKEEIGRVRAGLAAGEAERERAIHEARQGFKRLRALCRLAHPTLRGRFKAENRRWRDAGRLLSGSRDRTVLVQSLEKAVSDLDLGLPESMVQSLRVLIGGDAAIPPAAETEAKVAEVLRLLDAAEPEVETLDWPEDTEALLKGLRESQTQLRKSWREAKDKRSPEARHEWRKRVKDQSAQLRLFRSIVPRALEELRTDAKATAEHLGEEHDLWLLAKRLSADGVPPELEGARVILLRAIKKRRALLRRLAFEQGEEFSARSARSFAASLGKAWDDSAARVRRKAKAKRKASRPSGPEPATSQAL